MKVFHAIPELAEIPGPLCVAIGVFDGVHLGHQALILQAGDRARDCGGSLVVLTFHPHPARVLRPEAAPRLLTSTPHKLQLIAMLGCSYLLQVHFDPAFAAQPPEVFIEALAAAAQPLCSICVGHNWAFGKGRSGNVPLLRELGQRLGFETIEIDPVMVGGELVSSTRIRGTVEAGDLETAHRFLGREFTILGTISHGAGLGAKIGFPTANLAAHNEQFPPNGVYAVQALLRGSWRNAVANIGVRPTVTESRDRLLEVHLLDFAEDCYGEDAEIRFVQYLRPEMKFGSIDELTAQIRTDVAAARRILS